ncbi:LutC/YkgG family protein [Thermoflavimicrobium dichotomicum]|uniref:L-lactate dehydrogenase complex protein LldG n=1 Tax=Thermoflavimicrobium dichotomicum TaxID=46223 RepID=A0A1I3RVT9_9BACL|nr:LUD domain-containing protein [Thermoflavimicrobium dichotomicum]SFJ49441.1 L-lactate dehydrogenase complex protein LldG [Thermoflavimicrobium dichotomicum]
MNPNRSEEILKELERKAKEKEETFFQHIANRLGRPRLHTPPIQPVRGVPSFWRQYHLDFEERISLFMANWENLGGVAKRFGCKEDLVTFIRNEAETMQAKKLIRWQHPVLEQLEIEKTLPKADVTIWKESNREQLLQKAAEADIGIVVADYAIAHTGTVVVLSGATKGRSVSLLPTALMAIIRTEDVKTKMGEVLAVIQKRNGPSMPAGIHFITGPSRSSDIENDLTIGVHGPGIVYALLLDE